MKSDEAVQAARKLLQAGVMADAWTRKNGDVRLAIPVESPRGELRSWFVPVNYNDRLLGFFELTRELVPHRYSSFQRREGQMEGCPPAADWLDPATIRRRATSLLQAGETAREPYLSYDTLPSRLAWAVPVTSRSCRERIVFVAGEAVFEASGPGESTGGTS
jgi:hypothetical protein